MKVEYITLGCKVNTYETEVLKRELSLYGYEEDKNHPDLVIINSCSVTKTSDQKSLKEVRRAQRKNANVILMGCHVPNEEIRKEIVYIPNEDKPLALQYILNRFGKSEPTKYHDPFTRAFIKVQDGCNNFCSYCIIPYLRGRERSYPISDILSEVRTQLLLGHKEFILSGINLSHYGKDIELELIDLIEEVSKVNGVKRLRLGSLELDVITREFLDRLVQIDSFCPQFHLSLQSGSANVLKRMNRHYNPQDYLTAVDLIRSYYPLAAITTDIIVGFPGETFDEFQETIEFVKAVQFARVHIFPYSKREGTKAALYKDMDGSIKKERFYRLKEVTDELELNYVSKFVGREVEILIEDGFGYTREYVHAKTTQTFAENDIVISTVIKQEGVHLWI